MLSVEKIHKTFHAGTIDEKVLFSDFSLEIGDREFVTVIGSNGSGKTTLLNLIAGDLKPDSGRIVLDGRELTGMPNYRRARHIGRVFQNPAHGYLSHHDHLGKPLHCRSQGRNLWPVLWPQPEAEGILPVAAGAAGHGAGKSDGTAAGALSGGQRQALALIMATMVRPDLLLLDEHTAALDPKSSDTVMELTRKIVEEKQISTLMITHNLRHAVAYGNRTIMMHEGGVVLDIRGADKQGRSIDDYLKVFNEISIECGN